MKTTSRKPRVSKAELESALAALVLERDALIILRKHPEPDFELTIDVPGETYDTRQTWSLHAWHRLSGPVLVIREHDGDFEHIRWLCIGSADYSNVYMRSAYARCYAAYCEYVKKTA